MSNDTHYKQNRKSAPADNTPYRQNRKSVPADNNGKMDSISYFSHHSAWGSYSSFVLGLIGEGGGFILGDVRPPQNNVYIGYKRQNEPLYLLPFVKDSKNKNEKKAYAGDQAEPGDNHPGESITFFREKEIKRELKWATDTWIVKNLVFRLITPFGYIQEPGKLDPIELKFRLNPSIVASIEFDNSESDIPMTGIFALQGMRRPLSDVCEDSLSGAAYGTEYGFGVKKDDSVQEIIDWRVTNELFSRTNQLHRLSNEGGLLFHIKPGEKREYIIALSTYQDGYVTTNRRARYYYTSCFDTLEQTLDYTIKNQKRYISMAQERDTELEESGLNTYKKYMIAHFSHSYFANTELLIDIHNNPLFIVNEGEYQIINTLDLVIDQMFWEMIFSPWTVRNVLDSFKAHYSYNDYISDDQNGNPEAGIGFCHDQGVKNMFSPDHHSAYEMSGKTGYFSYMTYEEVLNWLLTASYYSVLSRDKEWLYDEKETFKAIFSSMKNRDTNNDGIMDKDSVRCKGGKEITTYDSLDESLGQATNNLYLAVKTWAAYINLAALFTRLSLPELSAQAEDKARICSVNIIRHYKPEQGYIPAVFENGNTSRIIPAIEGLIYPYIIGDKDAVSPEGRYKEFIQLLKKHLENVLVPGVCIDATSGGWKLSSTSANTWMSKIILNQYIARNILQIKTDAWDTWDRIHASWQADTCSLFAATDQIASDTGKDLGSRLYPRLVSSILWMNYKTKDAR
ncbi:MAG: xylan 1,4-beta-xylosidase [Spirochaetales bacterium]|nr:xylan 1,4-beta-xylosidase [Spirochaetales bacterium]